MITNHSYWQKKYLLVVINYRTLFITDKCLWSWTFCCLQVDEFKCMTKCPRGYLKLESGQGRKCVKVCPAGYQKEAAFPFGTGQCVKCKVEKCPRGMYVFTN